MSDPNLEGQFDSDQLRAINRAIEARLDSPNNPVPVSAQKPVSLGIIPDIHWNDTSKTNRKTDLDTLIDRFNSLGCDIAVQVGDLVSVGGDGTTAGYDNSLDAIGEARDYIENTGGSAGNGLDMPVNYTLGNHEYKHLDGGDVTGIYDALGIGPDLEATNYYVDVRGWRFVMLNSSFTQDDQTNAAKFSRIPGSTDPFDALAWLDDVLSTPKHTVLVTHYPLHNGPGETYFSTGNAYQAAQKLIEHGVTTSIHGHTHGHHGWDNGRVEQDPLGNNHYCAGKIDKDSWTYGTAPKVMFSWADFWTPRQFRFQQTLNPLWRDNRFNGTGKTSQNMNGRTLWYGDNNRYNLSSLGNTTDNAGSGSHNKQAFDNRVRISTGATAGSRANIRFKTKLSGGGLWSVPEAFATRVIVQSFSGSSGTAKICRGLPPIDGQDGGNWYGFRINANGDVIGIAGEATAPATERQTDVIDNIGTGEFTRLGAFLWSPHVAKFYVQSADSNGRDHYKTGTLEYPGGTTKLPTKGSSTERLANLSVFDNDSSDFQVDVHEWDFWKRGS